MSQGFSEQDIQLAGFFVRSKPIFGRILLIVALCADIGLLVLGGWYWARWFGESRIDEMNAARVFLGQSIAAVRAEREESQAKSLKIETVNVLDGALDLTDYIAIVENPNDRYIARVGYVFVGSNGKTDLRYSLVLPRERRIVGVFGSELNMGSAKMVLESVTWEYVDAHQVANMKQFRAERQNVRVENEEYVNANAEVSTDRVRFLIANDSPFNYFSVQLSVVMYYGDEIAGVEFVDVAPFRALSEQNIEIHTESRGLSPTRIEVLPHVNIYDPTAYIQIGG